MVKYFFFKFIREKGLILTLQQKMKVFCKFFDLSHEAKALTVTLSVINFYIGYTIKRDIKKLQPLYQKEHRLWNSLSRICREIKKWPSTVRILYGSYFHLALPPITIKFNEVFTICSELFNNLIRKYRL